MTIKDFCSDIKALYKVDNGDVPLNDRLIYYEAMSTALLLIKRELNNRKLTTSSNVFTYLPCITMREVPLAECCDFTSEKTISRSVRKLPKIVDGMNGYAIQYVSNVEGQKRFVQSTPLRYTSILNLGPAKNIYYWIQDGYLYVSSPQIKKVSVSALLESDFLLEDSPCDCEGEEVDCSPIYDRELKIPGYLLENVKSMVIQKLSTVFYNIPVDRTDDDSNQTSR
jgi:hypothetical protein